MSALEGLPSFSKAAFSHTSPQIMYKRVRRIVGRKITGQAVEPAARGEYPPTLVKLRPLPEVKNILLINGVDPRCKNVIKFKSTDFPLPFLSATSSQNPQPQPQHQQPPPGPVAEPESSSHKEEPRERKRPRRDSERRVSVDMPVQPERKRPKREAC